MNRNLALSLTNSYKRLLMKLSKEQMKMNTLHKERIRNYWKFLHSTMKKVKKFFHKRLRTS